MVCKDCNREKAIMNVIISYQKVHSNFAERLSVHDDLVISMDKRIKDLERGYEKDIGST